MCKFLKKDGGLLGLTLSSGNSDMKCFGLEMDRDTNLKCKFLVTWGLDSTIDYLALESYVTLL